MLDSLPLWFVDKPGLKFSRLRAEAAQQRMINGTRVFVLDYWQLVRPDGKVPNKADFMGEVADWCAEDAHEHGTTWIVLSQENRAGESLGSDGLARACDYLAQLHKHEQLFHGPGLDGVETLWWDVKFSRDGSSEPIAIDDVMAGDRLLGMVQTRGGERDLPALAPVGCLGKVTSFARGASAAEK